MIQWLLLVILVLWIFSYRFQRRNMYKLASKIPGLERELALIGVAHALKGSAEEIMLSLKSFSYEAMQYDGVIRGWFGHILYFLVINPVDLEMILKTCLEKDDLSKFIKNVTGNGLIYAPVQIWRRRRKIMLPAFNPKLVDQFFEIFSENSEKIVKKLGNVTGKGKFSIWPYLSAYTLDSVNETALGVQLNAQRYSNSTFLTSLNAILDLVCTRMFHLWLQPEWLFKFFPQYKIHQENLGILHNFIDDIIKKRRTELNKEKNNQTPSVNTYNTTIDEYNRKTFLDLLISLSGGEKGYTNLELREEILTLTIAATDTSAVATGNTLNLLAKYPKIQEKAYEELHEIFGNSKRAITRGDLLKMKLLERIIKESLRLFPPVPFISRKVETDITLPSGRVLPAGSRVLVSIWGCHRDPKYWGSKAEHFDPDRFLPERFNLKHACSFLPFSNGPRDCVGYQYALMSMKTSLATILRNYKVVGEPEKGPIPHIRVKLSIMMKDIDGYQVILERRPGMTLQL